jgi:hypothetical protein
MAAQVPSTARFLMSFQTTEAKAHLADLMGLPKNSTSNTDGFIISRDTKSRANTMTGVHHFVNFVKTLRPEEENFEGEIDSRLGPEFATACDLFRYAAYMAVRSCVGLCSTDLRSNGKMTASM